MMMMIVMVMVMKTVMLIMIGKMFFPITHILTLKINYKF